MKLADLSLEKSLWSLGYNLVAGIDEVGRGSWAGPVVAAAVVLPKNWPLPAKLADSKLLNSAEREKLDLIIRSTASAFAIAEINHLLINREGINKAAQRAMRLAVRNLGIAPDYHLVDGFYIKNFPLRDQMRVIKGDQKSASIAAASIIAKVYRDKLMRKLSGYHPEYFWEQNMGYGTKRHQEAIRSFGFTPLHRSSFDLSYLLSDSLA